MWPPLPRRNGGTIQAKCSDRALSSMGDGGGKRRGGLGEVGAHPRVRGSWPGSRAAGSGRPIASLERQAASAGAGCSRSAREPSEANTARPAWWRSERPVHARRLRAASSPDRAHVARRPRAPARRHAATGRSALDVAGRLAQAAVLVEVAAHELAPTGSRARADTPASGTKALRHPAAIASRANAWSSAYATSRNRIVLPALAQHGGVDVGEEAARGVARRAPRHRAVRRPCRTSRRTRSARGRSSGSCRAGADAARTRGRPAPWHRAARRARSSHRSPMGVASWVRNAIAVPGGFDGGEVARAAVAELAGRDLDHGRAQRPGDRREPSVEPESTTSISTSASIRWPAIAASSSSSHDERRP